MPRFILNVESLDSRILPSFSIGYAEYMAIAKPPTLESLGPPPGAIPAGMNQDVGGPPGGIPGVILD